MNNIHEIYHIVQIHWINPIVLAHHKMDIQDPSRHPNALQRSMNRLDMTYAEKFFFDTFKEKKSN